MPTPAAVHMESLVAGLVPGGRGPSRVPIAKRSDGNPRAPPAEGRKRKPLVDVPVIVTSVDPKKSRRPVRDQAAAGRKGRDPPPWWATYSQAQRPSVGVIPPSPQPGKAPTPTNDDSQPRKSAPRLIRSLLASCLFAVALVHANGSFLLTAVLPGVPAVLAPHHPPGLGEGEQTVR